MGLRLFLGINFLLFFGFAQSQVNLGFSFGYSQNSKDYGDFTQNQITNAIPYYYNPNENNLKSRERFSSAFMAFHVYLEGSKYIQFGVEPRFQMENLSSTGQYNFYEYYSTYDYHEYNLEIPLMIRLRIALFSDKLELYTKAGYSQSLYLMHKGYDGYTRSNRVSIQRIEGGILETIDNNNHWNHGYYLGGGLGYNIGQKSIGIEFMRYQEITQNYEDAYFFAPRNTRINLGLVFSTSLDKL